MKVVVIIFGMLLLIEFLFAVSCLAVREYPVVIKWSRADHATRAALCAVAAAIVFWVAFS